MTKPIELQTTDTDGLLYDAEAGKGQWFARAVKGKDDAPGVTNVIASTPDSDRANDIVDPSWELGAFKSNPVVMWAHQYDIPPVGRVNTDSIDLSEGVLRMSIEWDTSEHNELGRLMAHQFDQGFMSAVSVGFKPGTVVPRASLPRDDERHADRGLVFLNNELMELSAAPIPMNSNALAERVLRGVIGETVTLDDIREAVRGLLTQDAELREHLISIMWGQSSKGTPTETPRLEELFGKAFPAVELSSLFPDTAE